jgi:GT2 family glycosyltransferase
MTLPKLGLVTVLYNAPDVLPDFFASLACQDYKNFNLYVVDNSNKQEPLAVAKALAAQYDIATTFIDNEGNNVGVAAGNNQGIQQAIKDNCEYLVLLNNDLLFDSFCLLSSLLQITQETGDVITSPLILSHPENKLWYSGGYFDLCRALAPHSDAGKEYIRSEHKNEFYDYAPTCFVMLHRSIIEKIGLMDEQYFAYYDDTDFMYRAKLIGIPVLLSANTVIYHKVSVSTGGSMSIFSVYHLARNRIYFARKNFYLHYKYISIIYTVITRLLRAVIYPSKIRRACLKGLRDGFRMKL